MCSLRTSLSEPGSRPVESHSQRSGRHPEYSSGLLRLKAGQVDQFDRLTLQRWQQRTPLEQIPSLSLRVDPFRQLVGLVGVKHQPPAQPLDRHPVV
jgi:hypothetical protein